MNDHLNESTTKGVMYFGEWCVVGWTCCLSARCSVGVLLPGGSEGSHELKMRFLCNVSDILLHHNELQLLFHIDCIVTWQRLSWWSLKDLLHLPPAVKQTLHKF